LGADISEPPITAFEKILLAPLDQQSGNKPSPALVPSKFSKNSVTSSQDVLNLNGPDQVLDKDTEQMERT
jgi:hypothetical protein